MRTFFCLSILLFAGIGQPLSWGDEPTAVKTAATPVMGELSRLVGGRWVNDDPAFVIENRYDWAFGMTTIRGLSVIGKGSAQEFLGEAMMGWDPVSKTAFYVDCHGGNTVYQGTVKKEGDDLVFEFATIVGKAAKYREVARFADQDTFQFTVYGDKEGKWAPVHSQTLKRKRTEMEADRVVNEGIIEAPVDRVWAAYTTKEGQESWNVAHAEIDLKVGGLMKTHYDPKGRIGDPNTIENVILSYEPSRMLSIKVGNPPEKFPFKGALKGVWHVIQFEPLGATRTRLRVTGLGYGSDDESRKLREFFDKGNAYTIKSLQEHLRAKPPKATAAG